MGAWLKQHHVTPWASLKFALAGRKVVFAHPQTGEFVEARATGQSVIPIGLEPIASDMRKAAAGLLDRKSEQIGQVARNRYVVHNAWVVAGTRIPTQAIWNFHEAGFSSSAIIREYPRLKPEDVRAAIEFEAQRRRVA